VAHILERIFCFSKRSLGIVLAIYIKEVLLGFVNVYAIIIVLCISIDNNNIRTRSLRNTHSQETQHLSWETL
jgi:hypothetical protein